MCQRLLQCVRLSSVPSERVPAAPPLSLVLAVALGQAFSTTVGSKGGHLRV